MGSKIEAQVKEEVELMSVLARLAGYEEYGFDYARGYTADIDSVLGKFRSHEAVEMMKLFSEKYGLGYDRVMSIALQIECRGDSIVKLDTGKKRISPIGQKETHKFLSALNDFYRTSRFNDFSIPIPIYMNSDCKYSTTRSWLTSIRNGTPVSTGHLPPSNSVSLSALPTVHAITVPAAN